MQTLLAKCGYTNLFMRLLLHNNTYACMHGCSSSDVSPQHRLPRKRYDNFKCNGKESSLSECFSDGPFPYKCYSESYAGVNCQNNGR